MTGWPHPAPHDDGGARHLIPGLPLPALSLTATTGAAVDLAKLAGLTVVFVYPWTGRPGLPNPPGWDDIPGAHGSTPEAQGFRDLHAEFSSREIAVFGLSAQTTADQREFAQRVDLPFPLISDSSFAFADALRLPRFETGSVTYLKRLTLVVDSGSIVRRFYPVHPPDTHAESVLAELAQRVT